MECHSETKLDVGFTFEREKIAVKLLTKFLNITYFAKILNFRRFKSFFSKNVIKEKENLRRNTNKRLMKYSTIIEQLNCSAFY